MAMGDINNKKLEAYMDYFRMLFTRTSSCALLMIGFSLVVDAHSPRAGLDLLTSTTNFIASSSSVPRLLKPAADGPILNVSDIEGLYAAVNNPANTGATIVLAPGVYKLSLNGPGGVLRQNGGRLELQEDMSLVGVVNDRSAVVIDAIDLPENSYLGGGAPLTGAIRIGRGRNSIEWLTVRNAVLGSAGIETDLIWPGTAYLWIAHIASTQNARGLDVRNFGPSASGAATEVDLIDNDFFNNTFGMAEGIRIGNFQGATGSTVKVRMSGNRSYGNQTGRLIVNNRAINSTIEVVSNGNRFYENGAGTVIAGGLSSNATPANGNSIVFQAHGDHFVDNRAFGVFDKGGLVIVGGENTSIPNGTSNNTVNVQLWGCLISNNQLWDLAAIGARSASEAIGSPGINNHVTVNVTGGRPVVPFVEFSVDSIPADPNSSNSATIIR
jgi:hypothetical protein